MADDQTAALIAEARKMIAGTTFFRNDADVVYPQREAMIVRLAEALERAQGIIDGVRELCADERLMCTACDEYSGAVSFADVIRALSAQVKPDGE